MPEELTEEQWNEREEFWDFLGVPVEDGVFYEFSSTHTIWEIANNYKQKTR